MSVKQLKINPDFFKFSQDKSKSKSKSKRQKLKPVSSSLLNKSIKPNDIKKKLLQRIKEHQQKNKDKSNSLESSNEKTFHDEFKESLDYLNGVMTKRDKRRNKKTKKRTNRHQSDNTSMGSNKSAPLGTASSGTASLDTASLDTASLGTASLDTASLGTAPLGTAPLGTAPHNPNSLSLPNYSDNAVKAPPYGCLKNGRKPTFRQYQKTLKKNKSESQSVPKLVIDENPKFLISNNTESNKRKNKLQNVKEKLSTVFNNPLINLDIPEPPPNKLVKKRNKTLKRRITLGKGKHSVGVLIKDKKTRKKIQKDIDVLKTTSLYDIKCYLKRHNLIKIGSAAPEDVLRKIYEDSRLSGSIYNKNIDILLHNYMCDD